MGLGVIRLGIRVSGARPEPQPASQLRLGLQPASVHPRVRGTAEPRSHDAQLLPREGRGLSGHGQHHHRGSALPALGRADPASASLRAREIRVQVRWRAVSGGVHLRGGPGAKLGGRRGLGRGRSLGWQAGTPALRGAPAQGPSGELLSEPRRLGGALVLHIAAWNAGSVLLPDPALYRRRAAEG